MYKILTRVFDFYYQGFRSMTIGRTLWAIILLKLFIMFVVLKIFFFPAFLSEKSDEQKADYVSNELINRVSK